MAWIVNVTIQSNFTRISMVLSEQTDVYISTPLCTNRLIFGKGAFVIVFF